MRVSLTAGALVLVLLANASAQQNLVPVNFENATAIIEKWDTAGIVVTHGTGFFYCENDSSQIYLVTNRHVLVNHDSLQVRFNNQRGEVETHTLRLANSEHVPFWRGHPDAGVDIAAVPTPPMDIWVIDGPRLKSVDKIALGDPVYFTGFPLGLTTTGGKVCPLMRHGVVSYIFKEPIAIGESRTPYGKGTILIDGTSLGGNRVAL